MQTRINSITLIVLVVAMGGFLLGFDISVISGVIKFIEPEFQLSKIELGWAVASLSLSATVAMLFAESISDKYGRIIVLKYSALLFAFSAILSAVAPSFFILVFARMLTGIGVGFSLISTPKYIAEIAPADNRSKILSFHQLSIAIGLSVAFFTNYLIVHLASSNAAWVETLKIIEYNWRWMLAIEFIPAFLYFIFLFFVPQSPKWLIGKGRFNEALSILKTLGDEKIAEKVAADIQESMVLDATPKERISIKELFKPSMKLVMTIGIGIAILQQIVGVNCVFFYAPMIFEHSGIGTEASFIQAITVGLINVLFTIVAIVLIDKIGRKLLLVIGVSGIALSMFVLAYSFNAATYMLTDDSVAKLPTEITDGQLNSLKNKTFKTDTEFKNALSATIGATTADKYESELITASITMNSSLILFCILGFVASFAISLGPVMWVVFSELFPNRIRGVAISFVGFINAAVSFLVQLVFPWELSRLGTTLTFLLFGLFAFLGLFLIIKLLPETNVKPMEKLEVILVK